MTFDDILDIFFEMLKNCIESITLPTGENLVPTFLYSLVILIVSRVSEVVSPITFVDWRGALIATVLLLILAIIERRGVNEISRLYRVVKSGAATLKERTTRPGTAVQTNRGTNPGDEMPETVGGSSDSDGPL